MSAKEIIADMEILRHMLGVSHQRPKRSWCYRNYFNSCDGHLDLPSLLRLEENGLVVRGGAHYWHATEAGCKALGLSPAQIRKAFSP